MKTFFFLSIFVFTLLPYRAESAFSTPPEEMMAQLKYLRDIPDEEIRNHYNQLNKTLEGHKLHVLISLLCHKGFYIKEDEREIEDFIQKQFEDDPDLFEKNYSEGEALIKEAKKILSQPPDISEGYSKKILYISIATSLAAGMIGCFGIIIFLKSKKPLKKGFVGACINESFLEELGVLGVPSYAKKIGQELAKLGFIKLQK